MVDTIKLLPLFSNKVALLIRLSPLNANNAYSLSSNSLISKRSYLTLTLSTLANCSNLANKFSLSTLIIGFPFFNSATESPLIDSKSLSSLVQEVNDSIKSNKNKLKIFKYLVFIFLNFIDYFLCQQELV